MSDREYDNIRNIDGSKRYRKDGSINPVRKKSGFEIKPEHIAAIIFFLVFVYLCVNLYIYFTKSDVSIYEVTGDNISYDLTFKGIALRSEKLVYADYSGYISYYVSDGRKAAKDSVVFSVNSSGKSYENLKAGFDELCLQSDEIYEIKNLISDYSEDYCSGNVSGIEKFENDLSIQIADYSNENMLDALLEMNTNEGGREDGYICRTPVSGIISYKYDEMCGYTADDIKKASFQNAPEIKSTRTTGLIAADEYAYRVVDNDEWSIVVLVDEKFYTDNLEKRTADIYINGYPSAVTCSMRPYQKDSEYYELLTLDRFMSKYIDQRLLSIEFIESEESGLKIPVSAITEKEFYLVPLTYFCDDPESEGRILKKEVYNSETAELTYDKVYASPYYKDEYYAYIDMSLLERGDYIYNPETDERYRIDLVNSIEGVFNVNKGYYVFQRIERLRQNSQYVIVRKDTSGGIKLYDHIAMNASEAIEAEIIK